MQSLISIIIPCRNEEKFIKACLDSLLLQDYPKENLEVFVIDGMSGDKTGEIIKKYSEKYPFIHYLQNQNKFTPFGLNIGIKNAKGNFIIRMDAHAEYEKDYISKCVKYSQKYNVDNVGGTMKTMPKKNSIIAKSIALVLSHFLGAGSSVFRTGSKEPKLVDTVFGGCYKREVFDRIGLFNEKLLRSQDLEFNLRLSKAGGKILLVPDIVSIYYPKSTLFEFFKHNITDGIWAIYPLKSIKAPFKIRHYIPLLFVSGLIGLFFLSVFSFFFLPLFLFVLLLYLLVIFYFSWKISLEESNIKYLLVLPLAFFIRHIGYGFGSILGVFKIIFNI